MIDELIDKMVDKLARLEEKLMYCRDGLVYWWNDNFPGVVLVIIVFGLVLATVTSIIQAGPVACNEIAQYAKVETRYAFSSGCWVKIDEDRWIPIKNWRYEK